MADESKKEDCKYGTDCYRKSPRHKAKFSHPSPSKEATNGSSTSPSSSKTTKNPVKLIDTDDLNKRDLSPESKETVSSPKRSKHDDDDENTDNGKSIVEDGNGTHETHHQNFKSLMERTKDSDEKARVDYEEQLGDPKQFIHENFFVSMPPDFFSMWDFCKANVAKDKPPETVFEQFGLRLVGPFDVLAGKFNSIPPFKPSEYLCHWRFYYDVPEFQTVLIKDKSEIHFGYWRDDLEQEQDHYLLARNDASKGHEMKMVAANIFQAVLYYLEHDFNATPFNKSQVNAMKKKIEQWAADKGINLSNADELIKQREETIVCRTFHRAGLVVPFNRKTKLGYRALQVSDAQLKQILDKFRSLKPEDKEGFVRMMEGLQPIVTAAYIAVDESDFGTALELGIDLFCSGIEVLHDLAEKMLATGYMQVNRPKSIAIVKAHLNNRSKGNKLDLTAAN